jgi:hypothetical protein
MTAQIGDEIVIMSQELHQPVRQGEIREVRNDPGGVVYVVQWSDTGQESQLPHGPDMVIKHRHGRGNGAVATGAASWLSRLRHPLEWRHSQDLAQRQQVRDQRLARRVEEIIVGLGLIETDYSIAGGRTFHIPQVVSVDPGPPEALDIRILPGQAPEDFSAHTPAIAYDLGVAEVRVVPLKPSLIRLELLPHDPTPGHPPANC